METQSKNKQWIIYKTKYRNEDGSQWYCSWRTLNDPIFSVNRDVLHSQDKKKVDLHYKKLKALKDLNDF